MPTGKAIVHWIGCINAIKTELLRTGMLAKSMMVESMDTK